jgi:hypothetical protein
MTAELRAWLVEEARRGVRYTCLGRDDELEAVLSAVALDPRAEYTSRRGG